MNDDLDEIVTFAFDATLRRPACAILAAAYGADRRDLGFFDSQTWLTAPTPQMKVYRVTRATIRAVAAKVNAEHDLRIEVSG